MPPETYNRYSRWLHWLIAGLIVFMIILGWRLGDDDSGRFARFQLHKSIGISILLLSFVRLALRFVYQAPPEMEGPKWQRWAAKVVHWGFYIAMIGLPLTGWAMVSASPTGIKTVLFGIIPWPDLPVTASEGAHDLWEGAHGVLAKLITYVLIPLHVGAALKHHVIDKDLTINRMVPGLTPTPLINWRWIVPAGVMGAGLVIGSLVFAGKKNAETPPPPVAEMPAESESVSEVSEAAVSSASASSTAVSAEEVTALSTWSVDKAATRLNFVTTFQGEDIKGQFGTYSANIVFDPQRLEASSIKVVIDLSSANTGDTERDTTMKSDSFFGVATYPKATFEAKSFSKVSEGRFIAKGKLTLRGQTKPFNLPFDLKITEAGAGKIATVRAKADLDRTVFGVGSGDWASTDQIPAKVGLDFTLKASAEK